jgi:hypothetical protein
MLLSQEEQKSILSIKYILLYNFDSMLIENVLLNKKLSYKKKKSKRQTKRDCNFVPRRLFFAAQQRIAIT